jgi:hypothetical protein
VLLPDSAWPGKKAVRSLISFFLSSGADEAARTKEKDFVCICSPFDLSTVRFELFVYEVADPFGFFLDPETLCPLCGGFIWRRLEGKCERVDVLWQRVVDHGPRAQVDAAQVDADWDEDEDWEESRRVLLAAVCYNCCNTVIILLIE